MNYAQLRNLLEPLVTGLKDTGTHTMLPTLCEELGMPAPAADGSKRERMTSSFGADKPACSPVTEMHTPLSLVTKGMRTRCPTSRSKILAPSQRGPITT